MDFAEDGDKVLISAERGGEQSKGLVQVYEFDEAAKNYNLGNNRHYEGDSKNDIFGGSIAIAENSSVLVVGAEGADKNSNQSNGKAYVYEATCEAPCHDSPLPMKQGNSFQDCSWANEDKSRCENISISSHCPVTCSLPTSCSVDSLKRFLVHGKARKYQRRKTW